MNGYLGLIIFLIIAFGISIRGYVGGIYYELRYLRIELNNFNKKEPTK